MLILHTLLASSPPLPHAHLEVCVDHIEALAVLGQLHADVRRADEDALQRLPLLLYVAPAGQHAVHGAQVLLPLGHRVHEHRVRLHVLLPRHVLQLQVVVLEGLRDDVLDGHGLGVGVLGRGERVEGACVRGVSLS